MQKDVAKCLESYYNYFSRVKSASQETNRSFCFVFSVSVHEQKAKQRDSPVLSDASHIHTVCKVSAALCVCVCVF